MTGNAVTNCSNVFGNLRPQPAGLYMCDTTVAAGGRNYRTVHWAVESLEAVEMVRTCSECDAPMLADVWMQVSGT